MHTNRVVLIGIFSLLTVLACSVSDKSSSDSILAQINDYAVSESHLETSFRELYYRTGQSLRPDAATKKSILDSEFNTYVLAVHAQDMGLDREADFEHLYAQIQGRVWTEEFKLQLLYPEIVVTESNLRDYFVRFNTKVRAAHLYASTREESERLLARLQSGESFEDLADEVFINKYMREHGGDVGFFTTDEMDVAFEEAAFTHSPGEVVGPVATAQGYSIIKVTDRIQNPILTEADFQRQKPELEQYARKKLQQLAERTHMDRFLQSIVLNEEVSARILEHVKSATSMEQEGLNGLELGLKGDEVVLEHQFGSFSVGNLEEEWARTPATFMLQMQNLEDVEAVLSGMAYRSYMIEQVMNKGIHTQEALQASVQETYLNALAREVENRIKQSIEVTPAEMFTLYSNNRDRFVRDKQVQLQRIVLSSEENARKVYALAMSGKDFGELVKSYTESNQDLMVNGIQETKSWSRLGHLGKQLQSLEEGLVLEPIEYQTNEYHLYKCIRIDEAVTLSFEEAEEQIRAVVIEQKFRTERSKVIAQVKNKHDAYMDIGRLEELNIEI